MYEEIKYLNEQTNTVQDIEQNFMRAFNDAKASLGNDTQYSLGLDKNGTPIFAFDEINKTLEKYAGNSPQAKLRNYLKDKYAGKIINIGGVYDALFTNKTVGEYAYPAKHIGNNEMNAKKQVANELELVLGKAQYIDTGDFKNKGKTFDHFKTEFGIDDGVETIYYDAIVNAKVNHDNSVIFYDLTKIKEKGRSNSGQYIATPSTFDIILDDASNDVKYSISKNDIDTYNKAVQDNDIETAQAIVDKVANEKFANSKARDENGKLVEVYHASPSKEFTIFDKEKASPEGNLGASLYFTNKIDDANNNYHEGGADIEDRISRLVDKLMAEDESLTREEAKEMAREQVIQGEGSNYITYLNIENPYVIDKNEKGSPVINIDTLVEWANDRGDEIDIEDETDVDNYLYDYVNDLIWDMNIENYVSNDVETIKNKLYEAFYDELDFTSLSKELSYGDIADYEGNIAGNEIARRLVEAVGYDGFIDYSVANKFKSMNLDDDTVHYGVFNPNQIKTTEAITYDNNGNIIPLDKRFNANNYDIRYSISEDTDKLINKLSKNFIKDNNLYDVNDDDIKSILYDINKQLDITNVLVVTM